MIEKTEHVGVVGLGLLGRGIVACLLGHGCRVTGVDIDTDAREAARREIESFLLDMRGRPGFDNAVIDTWPSRYTEADSLTPLGSCHIVIESITENIQAKRGVYRGLETIVTDDTPIVSNTSSIPISVIQAGVTKPERFVGMHWLEPAHITAFIELIRGEHTSDAAFDRVVRLAESLGKEPAIVKKDVRGFVANRLYFALLREAFHLLESGVADAETIDRAFRNTLGWWSLYTGPFRNMDLTGIASHISVIRDLWPELSNATEVSATLRRMAAEGRTERGVTDRFYQYTPGELEGWRREWDVFTWEIRELARRQTDGRKGPEAGKQ